MVSEGPEVLLSQDFKERYRLGDNPLLFYCKEAEDLGAVFSDSLEAV